MSAGAPRPTSVPPAGERPSDTQPMPPVILALLVGIGAGYAITAALEQDQAISVPLLVKAGGLLPLAWIDGDFWRFVSYSFLHGNLMHLLANVTCLLAWGIPLARFFGGWRFLVLYFGAVVIGGLTSVLTREGIFVLIGASGGTSGLLGALFMFRLLRRSELPASFFVINIGLNVAITLFFPEIDWRSHAGGFLAGALIGAVLIPRAAR